LSRTTYEWDEHEDILAPPTLKKTISVLIGSEKYRGPEYSSSDYNEKTDMWAVGIILVEMLAGKDVYGHF